MLVVKMPDGTFVTVPETLPPEAELPDSEATRKAKLVGASAVRGAVALPALGADVAGESLAIPANNPLRRSAQSAGSHCAADGTPDDAEASGLRPEAEDTLEKYLSSIAEGVGGGLTGGPAGGLRSAVIGGVSGLGAETGAQASGDEDAFLPRLLGGLAGGGLGALLSGRLGPSPRVQELARESLDGITPRQIDEARSFMQAAGRDGVRLDAAQALEGVGASPAGLRVLRDTLANVKEGDQTLKLLRGQPAAIQERGATWLATNPGNVYAPEQAANNLSEAATSVINAAKKARSNEVRGMYDKAGQLTPDTSRHMSQFLDDFVNKPGVSDTTKRAVRKLQAKLMDAPQGPTVAQLQAKLAQATKPSEKAALRLQIQQAANAKPTFKTLHAKDADTMISEFLGPFRGTPISPVNPTVRGETKAIGKGLNQLLQDASPELEAETRFGQLSRDVIDPLKQGQVGGLATKAGYRADTQASMTKMQSLFSAGRDPATGHSPLLETARKLNKQDPMAFRDAAKTYYSGKISAAFDADIGGAKPTNKDAAERIYRDLFANQPQYTGMKDAVTAAAESAGVRPAEALRGLDNFAKIVKAARSQPDQLGGMTKQQIIEMAEKHHGANLVRIFGFLPFERMARNLESATMTKTMREMDKLITTPEGLKILAELSRHPVMSRQALALAATAGGVLSQVPETAQSTK